MGQILKPNEKRTPYKYKEKKVSEYGYSYKKITRYVHDTPSEKQLKLINDMRATCERVGISLDGMLFNTHDRNGCGAAIRALYTILNKHGYDGWGNPLNKSENADTL